MTYFHERTLKYNHYKRTSCCRFQIKDAPGGLHDCCLYDLQPFVRFRQSSHTLTHTRALSLSMTGTYQLFISLVTLTQGFIHLPTQGLFLWMIAAAAYMPTAKVRIAVYASADVKSCLNSWADTTESRTLTTDRS